MIPPGCYLTGPRKRRRGWLLLLTLAWLGLAAPLRADVTLPGLFSAHAVLQKTARTRVWGKAAPGENVRVTLGPAKAAAVAGPDGHWQATLDLLAGGPGPFDLTVQGKNTLTVPDVVVGEVWVCAGQSNMQWIMRGELHYPEEAKQDLPLLRQFQVPIDSAPEPRDDCAGIWTVCTPQNLPQFTAVGYYFGKKLHQDLGTPVGLLHTSAPGSPIEVWLSKEGFETSPELAEARLRRLKTFNEFPGKLREYADAFAEWSARYARQDQPGNPAAYADPAAPTAGWTPLTLPGRAEAPGAVWLRHPVDVPAVAAGKPVTLTVGRVFDFLQVYWNGAKVAETDPAHPPAAGVFKFTWLGEGTREGSNLLALRLFNAADPPGTEGAGTPALGLTGVGSPVRLTDGWLAKAEQTLPPLPPEARPTLPKAPFPPSLAVPGYNFNAMVAPLVPFTVRGIVWYQGEANVPRAAQYRLFLPTLITDYRRHWGAELPFLFCQLPNYQPGSSEPGGGMWPELREAQASALSLPRTGMAVTIDVGEEGNLHPRNKKDPGQRLALLALANEYGRRVACAGPAFESLKVEGPKARVRFLHADGGLVARPVPAEYQPMSVSKQTRPLVRQRPGSQLEGFALCGEDGRWAWADAAIEGDAVVVSTPEVPRPVAVRYDWSDCPWGNLANGAGLPAAPFRTDHQPGLTEKNKY